MTNLPEHLKDIEALKIAILGREDAYFHGYPCLICSGKGTKVNYEGYGHMRYCGACLGTGVCSDEVFKKYYIEMVDKWKKYAGIQESIF